MEEVTGKHLFSTEHTHSVAASKLELWKRKNESADHRTMKFLENMTISSKGSFFNLNFSVGNLKYNVLCFDGVSRDTIFIIALKKKDKSHGKLLIIILFTCFSSFYSR